jgi:hypothetical protein
MIADLIAYLLASATITALTGTRITPAAASQGAALPYVTVEAITRGPLYADDGAVGLTQDRVQIDCWATTFSGARALADAVIARLSAVRDVVQGATTFVYMLIDNTQDLREAGSNAFEYTYRMSLDVIIWRR